MDDLIRLTVTVMGDDAELLSACLALHVPYGWEEDTLPTGEGRAVVHAENEAFMTELTQALRQTLPGARLERDTAPRKDWTLAWREFFTPVEAGSRFLVLAPWMEEEKKKAGVRTPLVIEPKTAFGTGHHASTALCLGAVSDLADAGRIGRGMRFLDLGTGTGILGIACVTCGLTGLGLDIDMLAVENALENAALNGVDAGADSPVFAVRRGGIEDAPDSYDLILANILARPLMDMAGEITARLKPGGALALSGILGTQAAMVADAYMAHGLPEPVVTADGEWVSLVWA